MPTSGTPPSALVPRGAPMRDQARIRLICPIGKGWFGAGGIRRSGSSTRSAMMVCTGRFPDPATCVFSHVTSGNGAMFIGGSEWQSRQFDDTIGCTSLIHEYGGSPCGAPSRVQTLKTSSSSSDSITIGGGGIGASSELTRSYISRCTGTPVLACAVTFPYVTSEIGAPLAVGLSWQSWQRSRTIGSTSCHQVYVPPSGAIGTHSRSKQ